MTIRKGNHGLATMPMGAEPGWRPQVDARSDDRIRETEDLKFGERLIIPDRLDKPKRPHSFKLDPDLFDAINEIAGRENRSVNNLVETILWKQVRADLT